MAITGSSPLSLYFHIPFCKKKCPYCHFYVTRDDEIKKDELLLAFFKEWDLLDITTHSEIHSIYLGGGTPSLFGPQRVEKLLDFIFSKSLKRIDPLEVTLEINPEDVTLEKMIGFKKAGINRISMGVQALHDPSLVSLGRNHNSKKSIEAIFIIKEAGFDNISIDLMYDRPHQKLEDWEKELSLLKNLPITHLSLYNLTIEEGSAYKKQENKIRLTLPKEEESLKLHNVAIEGLKEAGFERYEISAFCKNNLKSVHNLGYWQGRPFYGFGPSAFSYIDKKRGKNISHIDQYLTQINKGTLPIDFAEELDATSSQKEMLAVGLRVADGVDLDQFQNTYGLLTKETNNTILRLIDEGYLAKSINQIQLTSYGQLFYDDVGVALI
jgi:oxygen-independent coproporphyrinogen-3 oxidase